MYFSDLRWKQNQLSGFVQLYNLVKVILWLDLQLEVGRPDHFKLLIHLSPYSAPFDD